MMQTTFDQKMAAAGERLEALRQLAGRSPRQHKALLAQAAAELSGALTELEAAGAEMHQREQKVALVERAEEALRESEKRYRTLCESSRDGIAMADLKGYIIDCNHAYTDMVGYTREELKKIRYQDITPSRWHAFNEKVFRQVMERGHSDVFEKEYVRKDGTVFPVSLHAWRIDDEDGKPVGVGSVVRDVTERRQVETYQALTARLLEELNRPGEKVGVLRAVTELIKDFTGIEAVGIRLRDGDDFPYFVTSGFPGQFVQAENYLCLRSLDGEILRDEDGKAVLECMCGNILCGRADPSKPFFTEGGSFWTNSTTELLAGTSEQDRGGRTRNRCNTAGYESVALIPVRADEQIIGLLQLNDRRRNRSTPVMIRFLEQIGASIGMAIKRHLAEEEIARLAKFPDESPNPVLRISSDGTILYSNKASRPVLKVWQFRRGEPLSGRWHQFVLDALESGRSGQTELECGERVYSLTFAPVVDASYVNVYALDVTQRKRAEEKLQWELAVSSALAELSGALIGASPSVEGIADIVLDCAKALTGSEHGYVSSIDPETGDMVAHTLTAMMGKQCRVSGENRRIAFPVGPDGRYPSLWGHALNAREVFYTNSPGTHQASRGVPKGHISLKNFLTVPAIVGEELVGQVALANSDSEYTQRDLNAIKRLTELYALAVLRKRGEQEVEKARDELEERVRARTGELAGANLALRQTNELLERMFAGIHLAIAYMDKDFNFIRVSRRYAEADDREPGYYPGRNHFELYPNEENEAIFRRVARTGEPYFAYEKPFKYAHHPERGVSYWDWSLQPVHDAGGRVSGLVLTMLDVTERKRARDAVETERERLYSVLNMLPGYVALKAGDYSIRFANHAFLDAFGEPGERPCYAVQFGRDEPCQGCPALEILQAKRPGDWEWTSPAGRSYHVWGYPFSDVDGTAVVLELGIDITERRELEKQVVETSEMERRSIGQDLHDTLGQNLTGLAFLIKGLARRLGERFPQQVPVANQLVELINDSVSQVRSLARGLDPVRLDKGGLMAGLSELASSTEGLFGISCQFRCPEPVAVEEQFVATHLYYIAQEAVNNAVKHARAKNIDITLENEDGRASLSVEDDGRGIQEDARDGGGMGLHIMQYRARTFGGVLSVGPGPRGGTVVACSVPESAGQGRDGERS